MVFACLLELLSSTTHLAGFATVAALQPEGSITRSEPDSYRPIGFYGTVTIGGLMNSARHMPTAGAVPREATHCSRESGC